MVLSAKNYFREFPDMAILGIKVKLMAHISSLLVKPVGRSVKLKAYFLIKSELQYLPGVFYSYLVVNAVCYLSP